MKLTWLRSPQGKLIGVSLALVFGKGCQQPVVSLAPTNWRSCETCFCQAFVWCVEHVQYVCEHCIELHCSQARQYGLGQCHFRAVSDMLNPERAERIHRVPERAKAGMP